MCVVKRGFRWLWLVARESESLVGSVTPQCVEMLATVQVPEPDGSIDVPEPGRLVKAATGQDAPIRAPAGLKARVDTVLVWAFQARCRSFPPCCHTRTFPRQLPAA